MTNDESPQSIEAISAFAIEAAEIGRVVAQFGLATAYFTPIYKEPGIDSINDIDKKIGSELDVVDPLLSAHRLAKFYVISSGDALRSCCDLISRSHPMHLGSAALARAAAEHASKAMFLADPEIHWKLRTLRTYELYRSSFQEYRSSHDEGAKKLIDDWERWRDRTAKEFSGISRQAPGSNRGLIERHFDHKLGYDELSRPTHGNATWTTLAVIQSQKGTNYPWCATLRNFCFALDVCIAASDRLCELWNLDRDAILLEVAQKWSIDPISWQDLNSFCERVRQGVDYLSDNVVIDTSEDPQPLR